MTPTNLTFIHEGDRYSINLESEFRLLSHPEKHNLKFTRICSHLINSEPVHGARKVFLKAQYYTVNIIAICIFCCII